MRVKIKGLKREISEYASGITVGNEYNVAEIWTSMGKPHFIFIDDNGNKRLVSADSEVFEIEIINN